MAKEATWLNSSTAEKGKKPKKEEFDGAKVFVGNLSYDTTEETLKSVFSAHGPVKYVSLMKKRVLKRPSPQSAEQSTDSVMESVAGADEPAKKKEFIHLSKGFAFVSFENVADAESAVSKLHEQEVDGRPVTVEIARPFVAPPESASSSKPNSTKPNRRRRNSNSKKEENGSDLKSPTSASSSGAAAADGKKKQSRRRRPQATVEKGEQKPSKTSVFMSNLPFSMTSESLKEMLESKGFTVESATVVERKLFGGKQRRSRGYGFVEFASEQDQKRAVEEINGFTVEERELTVRIAYEKPEQPLQQED